MFLHISRFLMIDATKNDLSWEFTALSYPSVIFFPRNRLVKFILNSTKQESFAPLPMGIYPILITPRTSKLCCLNLKNVSVPHQNPISHLTRIIKIV